MLAPATLAALRSTRAIPDLDVLYVVHLAHSYFSSVTARTGPNMFTDAQAHSMIFSFSEKVWSIVNRLAILGHFLQANDGGKIMIHLIWYIVVGLIAGVIAKSVMHVHMTIFWTIVLGIIGSIIGGAVTHMFSPPTGRFHPAGIIFSTLGAILVLYVCIKLKIHFPRVIKLGNRKPVALTAALFRSALDACRDLSALSVRRFHLLSHSLGRAHRGGDAFPFRRQAGKIVGHSGEIAIDRNGAAARLVSRRIFQRRG